MQDFETYIKSNYNVPTAAATSIKYNYSNRHVQDKASKAVILNHIITMTITIFDNAGKQLLAEKLTFLNDTITKASEKQLHTISPSEATNKFRAAKLSIIRQLTKVRQEKIQQLQQELDTLIAYSGQATDIIPPVMKAVQHIQDQEQSSHKTKIFDM